MQQLAAKLLFALVWVLTLPPLGMLYWLNPVLSGLLRITKYRQSVVRENLTKSFPEKSGEDLRLIERRFYTWMGRVFLESFKAVHWSLDKTSKRINVINPELVKEYADKQQDIIIMAGHTGNWEWSPAAIGTLGYKVLGVYKPQSSAIFDQLTQLIREKDGVEPIPMKETIRKISKASPSPQALLLIADQVPALGDIHYWQSFLNQESAWFLGAEKLSTRFNMPILYLKMQVQSRGQYTVEFVPISEGQGQHPKGELTNFYIHALDSCIREQPHSWLWSHRRWKHQPEALSL